MTCGHRVEGEGGGLAEGHHQAVGGEADGAGVGGVPGVTACHQHLDRGQGGGGRGP